MDDLIVHKSVIKNALTFICKMKPLFIKLGSHFKLADLFRSQSKL